MRDIAKCPLVNARLFIPHCSLHDCPLTAIFASPIDALIGLITADEMPNGFILVAASDRCTRLLGQVLALPARDLLR